MSEIERFSALEILDCRGRPTVQATCKLASGAQASASVPSGASTGAAEAQEIRDGDASRYDGLGCRRAVQNVTQRIHAEFAKHEFRTQEEFDHQLLALDGTPRKSNLGANAMLAASVAFARAQAAERGVPLYRHFADMLPAAIHSLPRPTINLFSGGKHAGGQVAIQDVLIVPVAAATMDECLVVMSEIYRTAVKLVEEKYGMRWLTADEGGLAPPAKSATALLDDAVDAIQRAGFKPGRDVCLAIDVAASHFYDAGHYRLDGTTLSSEQMIERVAKWVQEYPLISVEDALAEDDWSNWPLLRSAIGGRAIVLGDDLLCTNPDRIRRAIDCSACNALLFKVNQIGVLSQAMTSLRLARAAGWRVSMSVRSGETEDNWFADLAVGWSGDQVKAGSITQSERLAKYNRLLAIEAELHVPVAAWPGS